jgi:hypothetical protein
VTSRAWAILSPLRRMIRGYVEWFREDRARTAAFVLAGLALSALLWILSGGMA